MVNILLVRHKFSWCSTTLSEFDLHILIWDWILPSIGILAGVELALALRVPLKVEFSALELELSIWGATGDHLLLVRSIGWDFEILFTNRREIALWRAWNFLFNRITEIFSWPKDYTNGKTTMYWKHRCKLKDKRGENTDSTGVKLKEKREEHQVNHQYSGWQEKLPHQKTTTTNNKPSVIIYSGFRLAGRVRVYTYLTPSLWR